MPGTATCRPDLSPPLSGRTGSPPPSRRPARAGTDHPGKPLVLVGYSRCARAEIRAGRGRARRGFAIDALLISMIGVAPFAWLARVISLLGPIPYFENKARIICRTSYLYNPSAYNRFRERRFAVVAVVERRAGRHPSPRQSRPPEGAAAGAVFHRSWTLSAPPRWCTLRSARATDRSSSSSSTDCRGWHRSSTRRSPRSQVAPHRQVAATLCACFVTNANQDSLEVERSIHPDATEIVTRPPARLVA